MKRRDFLQHSVAGGLALAALPALGGKGVQALAQSPALKAMNRLAADSDRIIVLVQLDGGNDGLNTLVPIENDLYYQARTVEGNYESLAIPKNATLALNDTLGWHSSLSGFKELYDSERLAIVQGVSYPNPNRSHFRGTDIWLTASDSDVFLNTGWIGRYLETQYPAYPETLPEDPVAIQIGANVSLGFQSSKGKMAVTFNDPQEFYALVNQEAQTDGDTYDTAGGAELDYVRSIAEASKVYSARVKQAADAGANSLDYPATDLAESLKIVASLIAGGLQTRFYLVSIRGFDTHAGQTTTHAALLQETADAIKAFLDDIDALGHGERVAGLTFSEFGRRVQQNLSAGTDHGSAAPLFVFGKAVLGGRIHGLEPDLVNLDERGDVLMQFDFRQVYAAFLGQWFASPASAVQELLYGDFTQIPLFATDPHTAVRDAEVGKPVLGGNYPNPAAAHTTIQYTLPTAAFVRISILDMRGNVISRPLSTQQTAGTHVLNVDIRPLAAGTYFYRLEADRFSELRAFQVTR